MKKTYIIETEFSGRASETNTKDFEKEILEALKSAFPRQKGELQVQLISLVESDEL